MSLSQQTGYPPAPVQYGYPGYLGYDCQQTAYRIPAVFDENKKRTIDEVVSPTQLNQNGITDKRIRNQSPPTLFDLDTRTIQPQRADDSAILAAINSLRAEVSTNLKANDIKELATKEDVRQINARLEGYVQEVAELKETFEEHKADLREITELSNRNAASIMDMGQRVSSPEVGVSTPQRDQHGAGMARSTQNIISSKRFNLVIEGISTYKDPYEYMIKIGEDLGFVVYKMDIVQVVRLRRRDANDQKPALMLVSFTHTHIHDSYLRNKHILKGNSKYDGIWINADEPMEVRRLKSRYRRIAYLARQEGETVYFNHQSITIGENTYDATQLSLIPDKYKAESNDRLRPQQAMDVVTKPTIDPAKMTEVQGMDTGEPAKASVQDKV